VRIIVHCRTQHSTEQFSLKTIITALMLSFGSFGGAEASQELDPRGPGQ